MKNFIYLLVLFLVFTACQTEDTQSTSLDLKTEFEFKTLTASKIAIEKNGKIVLNVSNEKIMQTFKKFNKTNGHDLEPESFKIINVDGKDYLRYYSKNNIVSTIALIKDSNNLYTTGSTVCESIACASGGGCIPNGEYCTKCRPEGTPPNAPDKDCKRTTTNFEYND